MHVGEHEGGKGAVCLRVAGGLLFAGCYDGCVYVFRAADRQPLAQLRGPAVMLLALAVLGTKVCNVTPFPSHIHPLAHSLTHFLIHYLINSFTFSFTQ